MDTKRTVGNFEKFPRHKTDMISDKLAKDILFKSQILNNNWISVDNVLIVIILIAFILPYLNIIFTI